MSRLITTEDIHKWRDGFMRRTPLVLEKAGQIIPVCFFLLSDGNTHIAHLQGGEFANPNEKTVFARFIKNYCQRTDVVAMLFVSEGWMKKLHKDELKKYNGMQVKDIEGSQECVYYCFETKLTSEMYSQAIVRDVIGGKKVLDEKMEKGMSERGMFSNLLNVPVSKN